MVGRSQLLIGGLALGAALLVGRGRSEGGGVGPGNGGGGSHPPHFTGQRRLASEHPSIQSALDTTAPQDVVVIDEDATISDARIPNDVKIEGDGGVLTVEPGTSNHGFTIDGAQNVWIDGVELHGNGATHSAGNYAIGGPGNNGPFRNIRITNCVVRNFRGDGIHLVDNGGGDSGDVYIANNDFENFGQHGMVFGASENSSGKLSNVVIERNRVIGMGTAQGIGVFGQDGVDVHSVAVLGNEVGVQNTNDGGQALNFEEDTRNCIMYGNHCHDWNAGNIGPSISKSGHHHAVVNNLAENGPGGLTVQNFQYFHPNGPPRDNVVAHNQVKNVTYGIKYWDNQGPAGNVFYHNEIIGADHVFHTNNQVIPSFMQDNGPRLGGDVGLPGSIGNGVTKQTRNGLPGVNAEWSRGGPGPDAPVSVTVRVNPQNYGVERADANAPQTSRYR